MYFHVQLACYHLCVRACAHVCACVLVCARMCMNNGISPFLEFFLSHYKHTTYIRMHSLEFWLCGTIFLFSYA